VTSPVRDPIRESPPDSRPAIAMRGIQKAYSGVHALIDASFEVKRGEVHCLCGENGAGKSTLVKILAGGTRPDAGEIALDGQPIHLKTPQEGISLGIGVVYQELELMPNLSIMENISLGCEPRTRLYLVDWQAVRRRAEDTLELMAVHMDVRQLVSTLTVAQAQLVAIAKVLAMRPRILVLDEPTASLSGGDLDALFGLVDRLRGDGTAIIYISHRMEELFRLGDRVTVLRDGRTVATASMKDVSEDQIIRWMVGRETTRRFPTLPDSRMETVRLAVKNLKTRRLKGVTFDVHAGEILGCTGLAGCGQDALARSLIGLEPVTGGEIWINGSEARRLSPRRAQRLGLSLVPEDRKGQGLVVDSSITENVSYSSLDSHTRLGVLKQDDLSALAKEYKAKLGIRYKSGAQPASTLSGGNQQKVVLARVLSTEPSVLVLDEPTRGIDVATKAEIYQLIVRLAEQGRAILLISSEMEEVMALSHRLLVLAEGTHKATLAPPYHEAEILRNALPASSHAVFGGDLDGRQTEASS
jgi:ABC-type sugar transport system ATPase subunit